MDKKKLCLHNLNCDNTKMVTKLETSDKNYIVTQLKLR